MRVNASYCLQQTDNIMSAKAESVTRAHEWLFNDRGGALLKKDMVSVYCDMSGMY